jgi:tetratricopeptide (TPR) repeat protein
MRALRRLVFFYARNALRNALLAATFVVVLLGARTASAQGRVDVEKARAAYLARNYAEAEERLRALVDPKTGLKELGLLSQARMYLGAVVLAQGKREPAVEVFEKMILEDPAFEPDPLSFPGDVINTFFDVRAQLQEKIRQAAQNSARLEAERRARAEDERRKQEAYLAKIKQMATEEKITVRNNRLVAFLPFGAGQFQNGDPVLGWTFLVTEGALVLATAITIPMYAYNRGRAEDVAATNDFRTAQLYQDRADNIRTVNLSFVGAFAALAITGVVQANLAYVPETVETKKRDLPVISRIVPVLAPVARSEGSLTPDGMLFGIRGTLF